MKLPLPRKFIFWQFRHAARKLLQLVQVNPCLVCVESMRRARCLRKKIDLK
jgi:hypothetical protein